MKQFKKILLIILSAIFTIALASLVACGGVEEPTVQKPEKGTVQGSVMDKDGNGLEGAVIAYGPEDDETTVETDEYGKYTIKNVKVGDFAFTVSLGGYGVESRTLNYDSFSNEGVATVHVVLNEGKGTITGTVSIIDYSTSKLEGVNIKIVGTTLVATTDAKGSYKIEGVPMLGTKTVTATLSGYENGRKTVTDRTYKDGVARVDFSMTQNDMASFPGIKPVEVEKEAPIDATKTEFSSNDLKAWKYSRSNLYGSSLVESHPEGYCINANTPEERENMAAFIFAKVAIDNNHKFLTAHARVFFGQNGNDSTREAELAGNFTNAKLAKLGLYVIKADGTVVNDASKASFTTINTESFMAVTFDLSEYEGQTITIVLGTKFGYHCCFSKVEFGAATPQYITVTGVAGLDQLRISGKVTETSFDGDALKAKWGMGGGVGTDAEGIQLNGADPWKAVHYDSANPQPVNSYAYANTDITAANSFITVDAKIVNPNDTKDPGNTSDQGPYLPYISIIVVKEDGTAKQVTAWTKVGEGSINSATGMVELSKQGTTLTCDLSEYVGQNVTIVIAANVGYRATITGVTLNSGAQQ